MEYTQPLLRTLFVMASAVEARDPYTGGHLWRVSQFARLLARDAGFPPIEQARIALGGFLHDLGKIGVPDAILNKPGKLTDEEYRVIQTHPDVGQRLLQNHPLAALVIDVVHAHHERPDGHGYPRRLTLEYIPPDARIVGICDAFDAMTSTRPYRKGMPIETALNIIRDNLGTQFDPALGVRFTNLGEAGHLSPIVGHSEPGIPLQVCPNCGPSLVITRHNAPGDHLYCRSCGGESELLWQAGEWRTRPTGKRGTPAQLMPRLDDDMIDDLLAGADTLLHESKPNLLSRLRSQLTGHA
ncbi:HD-GYP domain-containing protein [Sedimenticola hydrogenitrophicus]|uniref:HD-GYP domain-containing protein n=1 Tax=Sedimenticola hydrogenitrophicus TaxID=2967975 RepID=UPI0021A5DD18|nr:HD-GYP domain-containing protein [Sedimenticola hydrogenitrophicus]